jgi:hypothetical protein
LEAIKTACPYAVRLIGTISVAEAVCRAVLRDYRLRGGWFERRPAVLAFLAEHGLTPSTPDGA